MVYRRKANYNGRRKRGFGLDVQLGRNVPLFGGSRINLGTRGIKKVIKREALKQEETKLRVNAVAAADLKHGTIYTTRIDGLVQGTAQNQRVGDQVFFCSALSKLHVTAAAGNTYWRLYHIATKENYSVTGGTFGSGIGSSELFRTGSTSPVSILNSDNVKVLSSASCKMDMKFTGDIPIEDCRLQTKFMKKHKYKGNTDEGDYTNHYLVVIPWVNTGSPVVGTTTAGNVYAQCELIYKDA